MGGRREPTLRFGILGPLVVQRGDLGLSLGPARQRVILAVLLLHANRHVDRDQLVAAVWGETAPTYAVNLLQKHLSNLRRILEPDRGQHSGSGLIAWTEAGYRLRIPPEALDLHAFDAAVGRARVAQAGHDLPAAAAALRAALGLWRGPAFEGLSSPLLNAERDRLLERRLDLLEDRIDLDLRLGGSGELVPELRQLIAECPLRERLHRLLMLTLYRAGRQADALAAFRAAREELREQLGVEPGPELSRLHQQILRADPDLDLPAPEPKAEPPARHEPPAAAEPEPGPSRPRPAQLPHGLTDFVGRADALDQLNALLPADAAEAGGSVVITAIAGTAGVGKTTLAVHWAHQISERFPDGQLYVNLRGFDPGGAPMDPAEAVHDFLDALGVPAQRIPAGRGSQVGLYRSLLADRRMLIVLDNAHDAEQVRPLLPGGSRSLVVITSRSDLSGLVAGEGARPIAIDLLPVAEARALLGRRLGPARIRADLRAADEIVALCARLPLALTVVAARAASRPQFPLSALAAELREVAGRLDAFEDGDQATDMRGVFSWSYRKLGAAAARVFRLMGLHAGPGISTPAVASLAGITLARARSALAELARAHLVTERAPGSFLLHDLLRAYAAELARSHDEPAEREAAVRRVLDHYLQTAFQAHRLLNPHHYDAITVPPARPGVAPEHLADHADARSWFANERPVLLAALRQALKADLRDEAWHLACVLSPFLEYHGMWREWQSALETSQVFDDPRRRALTQRLLGRAYIKLGRYDDADEHLRQALQHYRELADLAGQAEVRRDLALKLDRQGRHRDALAEAESSLALFRAAGHATGQARARNAVGWFNAMLGNLEVALAYCREALELQVTIGDRFGQAETWDSLGFIYRKMRDWAGATASYERALDLYRQFDDRYDEADTLVYLGDTLHAAGAMAEAQAAWRRALSILDHLESPYAERVRANLNGEFDDNGLHHSVVAGAADAGCELSTFGAPLDGS